MDQVCSNPRNSSETPRPRHQYQQTGTSTYHHLDSSGVSSGSEWQHLRRRNYHPRRHCSNQHHEPSGASQSVARRGIHANFPWHLQSQRGLADTNCPEKPLQESANKLGSSSETCQRQETGIREGQQPHLRRGDRACLPTGGRGLVCRTLAQGESVRIHNV